MARRKRLLLTLTSSLVVLHYYLMAINQVRYIQHVLSALSLLFSALLTLNSHAFAYRYYQLGEFAIDCHLWQRDLYFYNVFKIILCTFRGCCYWSTWCVGKNKNMIHTQHDVHCVHMSHYVLFCRIWTHH